MKCKYCEALLEEGATICPNCGKDQTVEETAPQLEVDKETVVETPAIDTVESDEVEEASEITEEIVEQVEENSENAEPEMKAGMAWWKAALMFVGLFLVMVIFVALILHSQDIDPNPLHWFESKEPTTQQGGSDEGANADDPYDYGLNRDSYTADENNAAALAAQIAGKCGDVELTNAKLQIYYWSGVYEFINQYQYYMQSMGLDLSKPFDEQVAMEGTSWQKFFLENAIFNWHKFSSLAQQAEKEGFVLSEASQQQIDAMGEQMSKIAQEGGFASAEEMLAKEMGALVDMESYAQYTREYYLAMEYFNAEYEKIQPDDAQLEDYFTRHEAELAESGVTKESKTYDVRHILLEPKGGTEDENGLKTYSDAEWEACLKEAQAMLDQWKNNDGSEDGFAELAKNHSADGGSSTNGGLYEDLDVNTSFVEEFKNWYLDESRKVGDTGIVKSVYGYHIMYLSATAPNWKSACTEGVITERSEALVQDCMKAWPITVNDDQIAIGNVTFEQQ